MYQRIGTTLSLPEKYYGSTSTNYGVGGRLFKSIADAPEAGRPYLLIAPALVVRVAVAIETAFYGPRIKGYRPWTPGPQEVKWMETCRVEAELTFPGIPYSNEFHSDWFGYGESAKSQTLSLTEAEILAWAQGCIQHRMQM